MPNEQVIQQGFVHMIFRSGPTQGEKRVADFIVKIGSNQYVFGAIGESGGEYLLAVEDGPTELACRDCCEFLGGHGPGEAGEAVGPCDEFFGGQCGHGVACFPSRGCGVVSPFDGDFVEVVGLEGFGECVDDLLCGPGVGHLDEGAVAEAFGG